MAATMMFASCNKEEGNVNKGQEGEKALMDLVIQFPAESRAADSNASPNDSKITTVTVFIFNTDGSAATGSPANLLASDFTSGSNNTYSLKADERIETTAGNKNIYVGINLPSALSTVTSEGALKAEYAASISSLTSASDGLAMLSNVSAKSLKAQEVGTTPTDPANVITVDVERLVSKVAARKSSSFTAANSDFKGFTIDVDQFAVGNVATHIYPVQRIAASKLVTPMLVSQAVETLKPLNAAAVATNAVTSFFYVNESRAKNNLRGEATYAVVRGKLSFSNFAQIVSDAISVTATATVTAGATVYMVRDEDNSTYFCANLTDASLVAGKLTNAKISTFKAASDGSIYCFYYVFLNADEADALAVYRNQYFNIAVNSIKGVGAGGDPTTPETPQFPLPDVEEPAIEVAAYLEVLVDVKPWDYKFVLVDLQ